MAEACPFCGAAWSEAMLAEYERFSSPSACGCCAGASHSAPPAPERDLCCDTCGRAIYRMASPAS